MFIFIFSVVLYEGYLLFLWIKTFLWFISLNVVQLLFSDNYIIHQLHTYVAQCLLWYTNTTVLVVKIQQILRRYLFLFLKGFEHSVYLYIKVYLCTTFIYIFLSK